MDIFISCKGIFSSFLLRSEPVLLGIVSSKDWYFLYVLQHFQGVFPTFLISFQQPFLHARVLYHDTTFSYLIHILHKQIIVLLELEVFFGIRQCLMYIPSFLPYQMVLQLMDAEVLCEYILNILLGGRLQK